VAPGSSQPSASSGQDRGQQSPLGQDFPAAILARFAADNLSIGPFSPVSQADMYGASACYGGTVQDVAVLLCQYASPEAAQAAEDKRLAFMGQAVTCAQRVDGNIALVAVDRDQKDVRGAAIQRVLQTFKKEQPL
jgi:hypothetical protein